MSLLPAQLNLTKFFTAGMSAGEESSNSHSKIESPCSSDHPDAKGARLAGTVVSDNSSCIYNSNNNNNILIHSYIYG